MAPLKRSGRFVNYSTTGEEAAPRWHGEGVRGRAGAGVNKPSISVRFSESKRESQFLLSAPIGTMAPVQVTNAANYTGYRKLGTSINRVVLK